MSWFAWAAVSRFGCFLCPNRSGQLPSSHHPSPPPPPSHLPFLALLSQQRGRQQSRGEAQTDTYSDDVQSVQASCSQPKLVLLFAKLVGVPHSVVFHPINNLSTAAATGSHPTTETAHRVVHHSHSEQNAASHTPPATARPHV